eukprot:GHUV01000808.1.p2 GENE.GHUV01000808.1~~GHUV01000808.1.p2  ORF type:complete len:112 (+),score=28.13 GHUV01000808.1:700-1035(+)
MSRQLGRRAQLSPIKAATVCVRFTLPALDQGSFTCTAACLDSDGCQDEEQLLIQLRNMQLQLVGGAGTVEGRPSPAGAHTAHTWPLARNGGHIITIVAAMSGVTSAAIALL